MKIRSNVYTLYHTMRTFTINTLGCKVNQYESQQIRELLEQRGLCKAMQPQEPDLVVVHTCCVTHTASAKSRQYIRKALRKNPESVILVSGCLPTAQTRELSNLGENVHLVSNRSELAATLTHWAESETAAPVCQSAQSCPNITIKAKNGHEIKYKNKFINESSLPTLTSFDEHTRAFLKVQDGCDGYCTYCIVPKTRPVVHSKPIETVLSEAQALVKSGHKEIVVTGVFLGAYGRESARRHNWGAHPNDTLAELLDKMAQIPNLARIRLSSLEPADVTERLLDTFSNNPNIMPHLHLPLQSGSDAVLSRMRRQYKTSEFRSKIESIKTRLHKPAITTDIIVGFPGETDDDFEKTIDLARTVGFAKMHVFPFSARRGTAAAKMKPSVDKTVISRRSRILRDLDIELGRQFRRQFIGQIAEVLIENQDGGPETEGGSPTSDFRPLTSGRSERYFKVYVGRTDQKAPRNNDIVEVKLVDNYTDGLVGIALPQPAASSILVR